jgi:F-type H+-transporting ATPase subunit gamma
MEEEVLRRRIATAVELQSLVHVLRSLAAVRVREHEEAVSSIDAYGRTIAAGLQVVMQRRPAEVIQSTRRNETLGAIVLGSGQGLCGNFNERIADYAVERMAELHVSPEARAIVVVGERVATYLETAGYAIDERMPSVVDRSTITAVILRVLAKIDEWDTRRRMERIVLFYNRQGERLTLEPVMKDLIPVDATWLRELAARPWPGRTIPTFSMDAEILFSKLIRQLIFFTIYRAFIESLAIENLSRLQAMQAAERNIDERLDDLSATYDRLRKAAITSELLDITTGYEAVTGDESW